MNILLCLNRKYHRQMISLINSMLDSNPNVDFNYYLFSRDLTEFDLDNIKKYLIRDVKFFLVKINENFLVKAPTTSRYPLEIYYRIFASKFLPDNLDKILYLDCDIIVKGDLTKLYDIDFENNYYIATTNIGEVLTKFNQLKNDSVKDAVYANTGVLLMNLKLLRLEQNLDDVFNYIERRYKYFTLPDQDIISSLYGNRIKLIDNMIYNLSDRAINLYNVKKLKPQDKIDLKWVDDNAIIIHYYGRNKPWNPLYLGILDIYYLKYSIEKDVI